MRLRKEVGVAWIFQVTHSKLIAEVERVFPKETGGVLVGYWATQFTDVIIVDVIGPGPKAVLNSDAFLPDAEYQEKELARI